MRRVWLQKVLPAATAALLAWTGLAGAAELAPEQVVARYDSLKNALKATGQRPDYAGILAAYQKDLAELVQARDAEANPATSHHEEIVAALEAGAEGALSQGVVANIFDKLMQKVLFQSIRHELNEVVSQWGQTEKNLEELEEAQAFYAGLKGTLEKREAAYGIDLQSVVGAAFSEMEAAIKGGDQLQFQLGRQLLDKTLMKTFYLAIGPKENGYLYKIARAVAEDRLDDARTMQAEAWAFYQSLYPYLRRHSPQNAEHVLAKLDLRTDVRGIDADALHRFLVQAFADVAEHEYEASFANWGTPRAAITALEGALFVSLLEPDLKAALGDGAYQALVSDAQAIFEAAKAGDRPLAEAKFQAVRYLLGQVAR